MTKGKNTTSSQASSVSSIPNPNTQNRKRRNSVTNSPTTPSTENAPNGQFKRTRNFSEISSAISDEEWSQVMSAVKELPLIRSKLDLLTSIKTEVTAINDSLSTMKNDIIELDKRIRALEVNRNATCNNASTQP